MLLPDPEITASSHLTIEQSRIARPAHRRLLARELSSGPRRPVFAITLRAIGSGDGLGRLPGDPRLLITICAWPSEDAACAHLSSDLSRLAGRDWAARLGVVSTRGSHRGAKPLVAGEQALSGAFAALTLGLTSWRELPRFVQHGTRLSEPLHAADGLLFAASAGWPLTGNCTFSVWESENAMLDFAYRSPGGHVDSARAQRPILTEQLNARMRLLEARGVPGVQPVSSASATALNQTNIVT